MSQRNEFEACAYLCCLSFGLIFLILTILSAGESPKLYTNQTGSFIPETEEMFINQTESENITVKKLG